VTIHHTDERIRTRMHCASIRIEGDTQIVELRPVGYEERDDPSTSFWGGSSDSSIHLTIANPKSRSYFKSGHDYYLDFTEAKVLASSR
jgi:hypothetical protein